jgi:YjjG family noncanonical pyrimidine nucleotidase
MYDWIFFDADDTLFDFKIAARQAFGIMMSEVGLSTDPALFEVYETCNSATWRDYEEGKIDAKTLRTRRFERFLKAIEKVGAANPAEMNRLLLENLILHTEMLDGALELLEHLAGQVKMAIITNGLREVQRPRIRRLELDRFFDAIMVSDEMGYAKPHPRFFELTMKEIGHPPKEKILVVGDNINSDIRGAKNAELASCWYNPHGIENTTGIVPDYTIQDIRQVKELILR